MNKSFSYQSDEYDRQSQRFVIPLHIKDELGNYYYSSTATLVKYNNNFYIIFAAHAMSKPQKLELSDFHTFKIDGEFYKLTDISIDHKIFDSDDIVIVNCSNQMFDGKNYFNLNKTSMLGFEKKYFAWTGFPASKSKAKTIHKSKSPDSLKNQYIYTDDTGIYYQSSSYFSIISKIKTKNKINITGAYDRKNTFLKYKGEVSQAPHPEGMSSGAMYFFPKDQKLKENLDDTFRFAGIGIEYKRDNTIIGVSKDRIIELLDKIETEQYLQFFSQLDGL
jgi:hypothetical protein